MARDDMELIGHGHGGGHGHGHGHGHGGFRGGLWPWMGPYLDWDPDDLYANPELSSDEIRVILAAQEAKEAKEKELRSKSAHVGHGSSRWAEESGFDLLGAETLTGEDWLNVFKGALGKVAGSGSDDRAKVEAKAAAEKKVAEENRSGWWKLAIGGVIGTLAAAFFLRR